MHAQMHISFHAKFLIFCDYDENWNVCWKSL